MTDTVHDQLQLQGLFDGPVEPVAVASWPMLFREHLRACPACQSMLEAERQLRAAQQQLDLVDRRRLRSGPPSPAERRARLAARRPLPIADLVPKLQPLPDEVLRFAASPLELCRTSIGVRVWHPDALEVLVLAAGTDQRGVVLCHRREATPGVGIDLAYEPEDGARVLALASNQPLEPEHWLVWFRDALASGELDVLVRENQSGFVHVAEATIPAPLRSSLLKVQPDPLPDADPRVAALLKSAASAGRDDNATLAASLYRQALELAFTCNDRTGQIKAGMGVSMALRGMGYTVDAKRVLRWVAEHHTLDATWASWICRHKAGDALHQFDIATAESWLREAESVQGGPDAWSVLQGASVAYSKEDWQGLRARIAAMDYDEIRPVQRSHTDILLATALAQQGDREQATELVARLDPSHELPLESLLHRAMLEGLLGSPGFSWSASIAGLLPVIAEKDGGLLSTWDYPPLLRLVERVHGAGEAGAAATLLRLRFFDSVRAQDTEHRLLGLCASPKGIQLVGPSRHPRARRLSVTPQRLRQMVLRAREDLRSRDDIDACRSLAHLLFESGDLEPGLVWVGSDGLLADAPVLAIAASITDDGCPLPALRDLVGLRRSPPPRDGQSRAIVSLADAQRDLPWASAEVDESQAALWLRGKEVTRSALQLEQPCGLLHVGLHARREQGLPELMFADGPMGPPEIAQISLSGAPVVLLAGCFTAVAHADLGVERSLADAFLRAGASAVVATRWPVLDREMHRFVRELVQAWPLDDVAAEVTRICLELRSQGVHARCWAAPVVY